MKILMSMQVIADPQLTAQGGNKLFAKSINGTENLYNFSVGDHSSIY